MLRRYFYHLASVLLFFALLVTAWSSALTITFSQPTKLESWLAKSGLYDHFVATAINQAEASTRSGSAGTVNLNDPQLQRAVKTAFTPQLIQSAVNNLLNANYAWLEGRSTTPSFSIDLSQAKASAVSNLGDYARTRAANLSTCSLSQLLQIQSAGTSFDALHATCLPPGVSPDQAAKTVEQQVSSNSSFLPNPVITSENINQLNLSGRPGSTGKQPYYQAISWLPSAYHLTVRLPWWCTGAALLLSLLVIVLASRRRKGLRRMAVVFILAGLVVLALIAASSYLAGRAEHNITSQSSLGLLQHSLIDVVHRAQIALSQVDATFAAGFVAFGTIILALLLIIRPRRPRPPADDGQQLRPAPDDSQNTPRATTKPPTLIQL